MASKNVTQAYALISERGKIMLDSKFIMAANCISSILKTIASVPCLTQYLIKCSQNLDFDLMMSQCTQSSKFVLPSNQKEIVAFVSQLLFKFDRKEIDLTKFIKNYYPAKDFESSYKTFTQEIIAPYILAFSGITREESEAQAEVNLDNMTLLQAVRSQIIQYIQTMVDVIVNDNSLKEEVRDDYLTMLNGFYYSFEISNTKMIKVCWIGLKSVLASYKSSASYMMAIDKILQDYAII